MLMDFNNKIIICPNNLQKFFLTYRREHPYENFSIYSLRELQQEKFGKVKDSAIKRCLENFNYSIKTLKEYFRYIESGVDENINDDIKNIKSFLVENNLLESNDLIDYKFKDQEVYVAGYSKENLELTKLLKELNPNNYKIAHSDELKELLDAKNNPKVLSFRTIDEEIRYVLNSIINNFGDNNKKKCIFCDVESYKPYLEQYAKEYGVKLYFDKPNSFADSKIGKDLLQIAENHENILSYIASLKDKVEDETKEFLVKVEEVVQNNLVIKSEDGYVTNDLYEDFAYLLSTIKINNPHYENEILVTSKISFDSSYVYYVLGASDAFLPKLVKNNAIFDDSILEKYSLKTSIVANIETEVLTEVFIKSNLIAHVSYYYQKGKEKVYPTTLLEKPNEPSKLDYDYSKVIAGAYVSKANDIKRKYNQSSFDLNYGNVVEMPDPFDSSFKKDKFTRDDTKSIKMSFTSLTDLFECPFKYYIKSVLKIDTFESTFAGKLGSFVHSIFEHIYDKTFEEAYDIAFKKQNLSNIMDAKELLFVEADKSKIQKAFNLIKKRLFESYKIAEFRPEENIIIDIKNNLKLEGRIDCYLTIDPSKKLIILDYKTGSFNVGKLEDYEKGLHLQVLIYCYLLSKNKATSSKKIAGAYYCPVLPKVLNENSQEYINSLKLQGVSFDRILEGSNLVKPYKNKFVVNSELESTYQGIIDKKISEAEAKIRNYCFTITPYDRKKACEFCGFQSICFKYFAKECLELDMATGEEKTDELE